MLWKIRLSRAVTVIEGSDGPVVNDPEKLALLNKRFADTPLGDYLSEKILVDIGITGGSVGLEHRKGTKVVRVVSIFESPQKLDTVLLTALKRFTSEQWGEGVGESFAAALSDELGITPLLLSSAEISATQLQLDEKIPAKRKPPSPAMLQKAIRSGDLDKLEAWLNSCDNWDQSLIFTAIQANQSKVIKLMIERGADLTITSDRDWSLLHNACHNGNIAAINILAQAMREQGMSLDDCGTLDETPLIRATAMGNAEAIQAMLNQGADINSKTSKGQTALFHALSNSDIFHILLSAGADPAISDDNGDTVVDLAKNTGVRLALNLPVEPNKLACVGPLECFDSAYIHSRDFPPQAAEVLDANLWHAIDNGKEDFFSNIRASFPNTYSALMEACGPLYLVENVSTSVSLARYGELEYSYQWVLPAGDRLVQVHMPRNWGNDPYGLKAKKMRCLPEPIHCFYERCDGMSIEDNKHGPSGCGWGRYDLPRGLSDWDELEEVLQRMGICTGGSERIFTEFSANNPRCWVIGSHRELFFVDPKAEEPAIHRVSADKLDDFRPVETIEELDIYFASALAAN